jgi:hypothetical protein
MRATSAKLSGWLLAPLLLSCSVASADAAGLSDNERDPPKSGDCVKVSLEARYRGYGYDHIVELVSKCDAAMRCTIRSGIDASETNVSLAPGESRSVTIFRGSPASEVKADVACTPTTQAAKS